jgi:sugar phosphate isomerase/epimerase
MNRRLFLGTMATAAIPLQAATPARQTFIAGIVPGGHKRLSGQSSPSEDQQQAYWANCDAVSELGFHHIEINNTRARIAELYTDRIGEFKDAMAKCRLSMTGLALFSHMAEISERPNLIEQHMLLGRFLSKVGGAYITHMIAPDKVLNESQDEDVYRQVNLEIWVENANEIGKRLLNQWGVKLAYHPEQAEVRTGLYKRFLASTDDRYVHFLPDTGHIAAGGVNIVQLCTQYRSRLACIHLKDFSPMQIEGRPIKAGNVSFGEGIVDFTSVIRTLQQSQFSGYVMSESGGTNKVMHDYMINTLGLTI